MFSIFLKVSCSWQGENPNQTRKHLTNIAQTWVMRFPKSRTCGYACSRCCEASLIFSSLLPCRRGRRWKSSRWRRFTKCRSANRGEWRSLSAGEYVLLIHLGTSEHSCRSGLCSVFCSELMMRDNLFEMVTSSRTFYVQVTHMNRTHGGAATFIFLVGVLLFVDGLMQTVSWNLLIAVVITYLVLQRHLQADMWKNY